MIDVPVHCEAIQNHHGVDEAVAGTVYDMMTGNTFRKSTVDLRIAPLLTHLKTQTVLEK